MTRLATAAAIVLAAYLIGPTLWSRVTLYYWQTRCLKSAPPAIVYEENAEDAQRLLATHRDYVSTPQRPAAVWFPQHWERFYALLSPPGRQTSPLVFFGKRSNGSTTKIIAVDAGGGWDEGRCTEFFSLDAIVIDPGSALSPARIVRNDSTCVLAGSAYERTTLRLSSAIVDPNDATHFEIPFQLDDWQGVIDGWFRPDGSVLLERRTK